jgi:type I restriction enzyme, R subunit
MTREAFRGHEPYTEAKMNQFPESQTAGKFLGKPPHDPDEYQVMVVAEKYQTGFDAPMLHTMFVDKKLEGVNAVQTLSRLNRTHPGKTSTFVLDFVNDPEDIQAAFAPCYEVTLATETTPEQLYDTWRTVEDHLVVTDEDVERFARAWFALDNPEDTKQHPTLLAALKPCEDRFAALGEDDQDAFRSQLQSFVRMYVFLSQVLTYADTTMEKRYALSRMLTHRLRDQRSGTLDLGDDVEMTYLRIEAGETQDISLEEGEGEGELTAFTGDGTLRATQEELVLLSDVIEKLNERFSTNFSEADAVKFESLTAQLSDDPLLQEQAAANDLDHFQHAFDARFTSAVVDWMKDSEDLAVRLLDDPEFADIAKTALVRIVHRQASERHQSTQ